MLFPKAQTKFKWPPPNILLISSILFFVLITVTIINIRTMVGVVEEFSNKKHLKNMFGHLVVWVFGRLVKYLEACQHPLRPVEK